MNIFALIAEGLTDHAVIKNIIRGYFKDPNIRINALVPLGDATDRHCVDSYSNWLRVFKYCESEDFEQAFEDNEYVIIQIDTDVLDGAPQEKYRVSHSENGIKLTPENLINNVKTKFIELIGTEVFSRYQDRIIFAICVHEIECWLLSLHCKNITHKGKITNCLFTLNQSLNPKKPVIKGKSKKPQIYHDISIRFFEYSILIDSHKANSSLQIFVEQLISKFPQGLTKG